MVATPIGNMEELPPRAIRVLEASDLIACEDTRRTGNLIKMALGKEKPLVCLEKFREKEVAPKIIEELKSGKTVSYMSDAGYPLVSDPGFLLVDMAIQEGIPVSVVNGSSAFLSGLVPSGLATDHFYFEGFLPSKSSARKKRLEHLKNLDVTLIFYEAPHRIEETLKDLREVLGNRQAVIARELTKIHEEFLRGSLEELLGLDHETIRGEIVLLVEGAKEVHEEVSEEDVLMALRIALSKGLSGKDAVEEVSSSLGIKKKQVYSLYLSHLAD